MTTNANPSAAAMEFWKEWAEKSNQFWSKMGGASQTPEPSAIWRDFFSLWSESWLKAFGQQATPDIFQTGQKLWMDQIEAWSQVIAKAMGTEDFAKMLGESLNRALTWAERNRETVNPQIDSLLWAANIPSRSQMDRLLTRVIGLEDRLDDLEVQNRALLKELKAVVANLQQAAARQPQPQPGPAKTRRSPRAKRS